jgi:hypothetical protein
MDITAAARLLLNGTSGLCLHRCVRVLLDHADNGKTEIGPEGIGNGTARKAEQCQTQPFGAEEATARSSC